MTLLQFLNKLRKSGGDITRLHVRIKNADSSWGAGFKVNGLRGKRMTIEYSGDYVLMSGHSVLSCVVDTMSRISSTRKRNLTGNKENLASILVTVVRP